MWESFLEEGKIIHSHLPQSRDLRVLNLLIRFYLSIEDGECQVEPDLGVLSKFQEVHKNGKDELDDHLMLVATDPTDVDDIWISGKMTPLGQASSFFPPRAYREALGRIMETDLFWRSPRNL